MSSLVYSVTVLGLVAEPLDWLRDWTDADVHLMNEAAEALSSQWKDRCKAGAFVAAAASKVEQWFIDYGPDY